MRFFKAISYFFKMLFDRSFFNTVKDIESGALSYPARILSLLQREGRLIDFLMEDISSFSDSQVGAAVKNLHKGCRKTIFEYMKIVPVSELEEGSMQSVEQGFDPSAIRLIGNIKGEPPFKGKVVHHGWKIADLSLPRQVGDHDNSIIAPAEIEL